MADDSEITKFLQNLKSETDEWVNENIISSAQQQIILDRYPYTSFKSSQGKNYSRLVTILATLGAVATGLGAILFIAGNWENMPLIGKLLLAVITIIGTNLIGYWIKYIKNIPRIGNSFFFLGAILFGGSTFLAAQAYHLEANNPDLLFWWLAGVLPIAYLTKTRSVFILSIVILFVWPGWKIFDSDATAQILIPIYLAIGTSTYVIGKIHRERIIPHSFGITLIFTGVISIFASIYLLSFPDIWRDMWSDSQNLFNDNLSLLLLTCLTLMFIISLLLILTIKPINTLVIMNKKLQYYELFILFVLWASAFLVFLNPHFNNSEILFSLLFNLIYLLLTVATVFYGIFLKQGSILNLGIVAFSFLLFTRYLDIFLGLLGTGLFLLSIGPVLIIIGFTMEKMRRKILLNLSITGDQSSD